MQLTLDEFHELLAIADRNAYWRGYKEGQTELVSKQQAEIRQPMGGPQVSPDRQGVAETLRAVPRGTVTSALTDVDDSF